MAQPSFDRRRINGPEESYPPIFDDEINQTSTTQISRKGRQPDDIRPIFLQPKLISQASGSAYIEMERNKIACAVYGPRQAKNVAFQDKGRLNVEVKFAPYSCTVRRAPLRDVEDRSISMALYQAIVSSVRLETFPKAVIDIFVTILETDGTEGCVSAGVIAASTALADAGIEILGMVPSCSAACMGTTTWLDPSEEESKLATASIVVSSMPALSTITSVWQVGQISPDNLIKNVSTCQGRCDDIHTVMADALLASTVLDETNLELSDGPAPINSRTRGRSYSVSGFDFQQDLLPLSASVSDPSTLTASVQEKNISLVNGIALVVGLQVFCVVVANTHSVGASLVVWVLSGLLAWTGASSFAELGSAIPQNGGAQAYLSYAYGPLVSYLFAWTAIIALKPGGNAVISLIFGEYVNRMIWHTTRDEVSPDDIPQWAIKLTATIAVVIVTILCVAASKLGPRVAVVFTSVKITSLVLVTVLGIVQLARGKASRSLTEPLFSGSSTSPSSYSLALYSGLWAFDGWDQANFVGGEMTNPEKNIPRAIHSSMVIVTLLFLLANISYFVVLDKDVVGMSNTVALDFGRTLFGAVGGSIFAFMVAFSCFGALNGSFFTSSRLVYAAGRERYLPAIFGRLHSTRKTPLNAALLQASITIAFIMLGSGFRSLINFSVVASWAFYFLTVLGLVILRIKEPMLERPYKTWIVTPLVFCAVALFLLCMPIIAAPKEAIAVLGFVTAGIPVYYITQTPEDQDHSRIFRRLTVYIRAEKYQMTCGGCSGAITRVLDKAKANGDGVSSFEVSLEKQEVLVNGTIEYEELLAKLKKTGKEVRSGTTLV
ncbi:hypothetical protein CVT24_010546 [Panaeolus cyanescens]|uniref:HMA domain-containing protein n=1 Tax=Panaeolus cyanescens TaxID=181874 RepID=A0A409YYI3_9AGAR|nr:hypothetical protein CVT24_010546 [Panaeolus cyanescens]